MATSTCVKCDGHRFEIKEAQPKGAAYKFYFVQCASCGGVVGVVNISHVPTMLRKIAEKLNVNVDL